MNQISLLSSTENTEDTQKTVHLENIHAIFNKNLDGSYDVILEINSNKFLIVIQKIANEIEKLEIITSKWFIEISNKIIIMIKKLIEHLRYRID